MPYAAHTPIPIPHHWKVEVKKQSDSGVRMGIICEAPVGETTEWCMRMVTVAKKDGSLRRTTDFQPINKYCEREPLTDNAKHLRMLQRDLLLCLNYTKLLKS